MRSESERRRLGWVLLVAGLILIVINSFAIEAFHVHLDLLGLPVVLIVGAVSFATGMTYLRPLKPSGPGAADRMPIDRDQPTDRD